MNQALHKEVPRKELALSGIKRRKSGLTSSGDGQWAGVGGRIYGDLHRELDWPSKDISPNAQRSKHEQDARTKHGGIPRAKGQVEMGPRRSGEIEVEREEKVGLLMGQTSIENGKKVKRKERMSMLRTRGRE